MNSTVAENNLAENCRQTTPYFKLAVSWRKKAIPISNSFLFGAERPALDYDHIVSYTRI